MSVPMPTDTDLPDTLVLGLTARHLLLASPGVALIFLGGLLGVTGALPGPVVLVGVVVVAAATAFVVLCNPDGLTYDRYLRARRRHRRSPPVEVAAELAALPAWTGGARTTVGPLGLPWDGLDEAGIVALGRDESKRELGFAAVLRLGALDQEALDREVVAKVVSSLGTWLSALDCDAQVLVRRCGSPARSWARSQPPGRRRCAPWRQSVPSASAPMSCCAGATAAASPTGCGG